MLTLWDLQQCQPQILLQASKILRIYLFLLSGTRTWPPQSNGITAIWKRQRKFTLSTFPVANKPTSQLFSVSSKRKLNRCAHCWWLCALTSVLRNKSVCGDFLTIVKLHFYATKNQICCVTRGRLNATSRKNFRSEIIRLFLGRTVATPTRRSSRLTRPSDFSEDDETRYFRSTSTFIFPPRKAPPLK